MRAVLFDVDGVVVHGFHADPARQRRWNAHLAEDLGIDPEAFNETFIRGPFARDVIPGRRSLVAALEETLPTLGFTGSPLTVIAYWLSRDSQLNLPLLDQIRRLRRRGDAGLFLATNQEHLRAAHLWGTLGLGHVFDDIFHSARLGAAKPHSDFFEAVSKRLAPQEQPPLLFDDSPAVVDAANAFGWEAVLYGEIGDFVDHPWIAPRIS